MPRTGEKFLTDEIPEVTAEDHRVRVGAERREKTRLKLLESALLVFTEKGLDNVVIDGFIAAAGVSRGTFYNHFRTTNELLLALATGMSAARPCWPTSEQSTPRSKANTAGQEYGRNCWREAFAWAKTRCSD